MANDLDPNFDPNFDPFERLEKELTNQRIIGSLLKFIKGDWKAGQNNDDVDEGTRLLAYISAVHDGWIYWSGGRPEKYDIDMVAMNARVKSRSELGDTEEANWPEDSRGEKRDPWQRTRYLVLANQESGELYTYPISTEGAKQALGGVVRDWNAHRKLHGDAEQPIVELGASKYKHPVKAYGWVPIPILKVVGYSSELPQELIDRLPQVSKTAISAPTEQSAKIAPAKETGNGSTPASQVQQIEKKATPSKATPTKAVPPAKAGKATGKRM